MNTKSVVVVVAPNNTVKLERYKTKTIQKEEKKNNNKKNNNNNYEIELIIILKVMNAAQQ